MNDAHPEQYLSGRTKKQDLVNARHLLQKKINTNHTNSYRSSPMDYHVDGGNQTCCFNVLCYGFVQVHRQVFLGSVSGQTSTYGKSTYELPARVYRDSETGNWWLMFYVIIGYWPGEIFTHLGDDASVVRYGGIAGAKPRQTHRRWEMDIYLNFRTIRRQHL
ncbi:hypothetical protein C5167_014704 [Papaver somniferum]|uniref:Neprosin PEP catalytic domain-containing protein n=1 Tax=Papaver somniferum TaxID=3469 RepID=A0A4Y7J5W3_PAPSO|nr:hypothetical protein C5167_014704 [Papaver somniferum]